MRYAVVWYVLRRVGMRYAVLSGMCYAVLLWISQRPLWTSPRLSRYLA